MFYVEHFLSNRCGIELSSRFCCKLPDLCSVDLRNLWEFCAWSGNWHMPVAYAKCLLGRRMNARIRIHLRMGTSLCDSLPEGSGRLFTDEVDPHFRCEPFSTALRISSDLRCPGSKIHRSERAS